MYLRVFKKVFRQLKYILISLFAFLVLIVLAAWLPNLALVKIIPFGLVTALPTTLGPYFYYLLLVALLFGVNVSLSICYFKQAGKMNVSGLGGIVVSLFGLGCASCGSLILAPILGTAIAGGIPFLPFGGLEISILGVVLLIWSMHVLVKKIDQPYG